MSGSMLMDSQLLVKGWGSNALRFRVPNFEFAVQGVRL